MGGGGGCCIGNCCIGDCCVANCGFCCIFDSTPSCCVGDYRSCTDCGNDRSLPSGSVQKDPAAEHAAAVANELADMRQKATDKAKKDEAECLRDIDDNIGYFVKLLEEVNQTKFGGRSLNLNIDKIKEINEKLHDDVVGFIGKQLDNRLVMTDKELSVILEERDNGKRKKNFDDFYQKVYRDAIRALVEKIETAVREQSASIEREIQNRLDEVKNNMDEETDALVELQTLKTQEDSRVAEKQVEYMFYEDLCDILNGHLKIGGRR